MQIFIDSIREEVKDIRNTVNELKESLTFSQKDIDDAQSNISKIETKITGPMKTSAKHMATMRISCMDKSLLKTTVDFF